MRPAPPLLLGLATFLAPGPGRGLLQEAAEDEATDDASSGMEEVSALRASARLWEEARARGVSVETVCVKEYQRAMAELRGSGGTDLVIGAYDGLSWDPAQTLMSWYWNTPHRRKIMVEAAPPIYRRLQDNARNFTNVTLLNAAVGESGENFTLYCWNAEGQGPLEPAEELRTEKGYWGATCVGGKAMLLNALKVCDTPWFQDYLRAQKQTKRYKLKAISPDEFTESTPEYVRTFSLKRPRAEELERLVDRHISTYSFSANSIGDLIDTYGLSDVGYVQVDIEDKSDPVALDLVTNHMGKDGLHPKVVLFEYHHFPEKGFRRLEELGYEVCKFNYYGGNVLAYRP